MRMFLPALLNENITSEDLTTPISVEENVNVVETNQKSGTLKYTCLECDYRTAYKAALTVHMRTHSKEKPFGCEYCSFRSITKGNLTQHMKKCRERPSISKE